MSLRLNGKIVEVGATENNSGVGRSGEKANVSEDSGVKTHTLSRRLSRYSGLEHCPSLRYHVVCHGFPALSMYFSNLYEHEQSIFVSVCQFCIIFAVKRVLRPTWLTCPAHKSKFPGFLYHSRRVPSSVSAIILGLFL